MSVLICPYMTCSRADTTQHLPPPSPSPCADHTRDQNSYPEFHMFMKLNIGRTLASGTRMALFRCRFFEHLDKGSAMEHFNEFQITNGWDSSSHAFRAGGQGAARLLGSLLSKDSCEDGFVVYDTQCLVIFPPGADSLAVKQWLNSGTTDADPESRQEEEGEGDGSEAEEEEEEEDNSLPAFARAGGVLDEAIARDGILAANPFTGFDLPYAMESLDHAAKRQRI